MPRLFGFPRGFFLPGKKKRREKRSQPTPSFRGTREPVGDDLWTDSVRGGTSFAALLRTTIALETKSVPALRKRGLPRLLHARPSTVCRNAPREMLRNRRHGPLNLIINAVRPSSSSPPFYASLSTRPVTVNSARSTTPAHGFYTRTRRLSNSCARLA